MNKIKEINNRSVKKRKLLNLIAVLFVVTLIVSVSYKVSNTKILYEVQFVFYNKKIEVTASHNQKMNKLLKENQDIKIDDDDVIYINDKIISKSQFNNLKITSSMEVIVDIVNTTNIKMSEQIPFTTITQSSQELFVGEEQISVVGVNGEVVKTFEVVNVNGIDVSKTLTKTDVTKKVVDEVKIVGTKAVESTPVTPPPPTPGSTPTTPSTPVTTPPPPTTPSTPVTTPPPPTNQSNCIIWVVDAQNPNGKCVK